MTTILAKKPILRTTLLLIALIATISLAFVFRPKAPLYALADLARKDQPEKPTLSLIVISASTGTQKADIFHSTAKSADEAFSFALEKVATSPDYPDYTYFRLDAAYGATAAAPTAFIDALPAITEYSYFTSTDTHPKKLSADPPTLSPATIKDLIHKNAFYLANKIDSDGKFIYGLDILTGAELTGYSTNIHASTISALLRTYSLVKDPTLLQRTEKALTYSVNFTIISDADPSLAYTENSSAEAIDLGATALTAIALADYHEATGNTTYDDLLQRLINGAESMYLGTDCQPYGHELDLDLTPRNNSLNPLYNVQVTYALIRAYSIFKDPTYLDKITRNLDYMTERTYAATAPYWFPLTVEAYRAAAESPDAYPDIPAPSRRSPGQIYTKFVEPWAAMFSPAPSTALYSIRNSSSNYLSYLDDNQAALFELLDALPTKE